MTPITVTKENFEQEVLQATQPVLLDFWATWCGPCRMVSPIIEEIANETEGVVVGKINIDEQPDLAAQYGVMSIPTLMVLENGEVVKKAVGARPKNAILQMLGK